LRIEQSRRTDVGKITMWGLHTHRAKAWHGLIAFSLVIITQITVAATGSGIGLEDAIDRTLESNPELVAFGYQIQAQQGRLTQAQVKPSAELGLVVENALGSGDYKGVDGAETTLSLGWVLERGKREALVGATRAGVSALEAQKEIQRLDVIARTAYLFLENLEYQERLRLSHEATALAEQTVATVRKQVTAGRAPSADLARSEAELARVRLAAEDISHELKTARRWLAAQWGAPQADFSKVLGDPRQLPSPGSFARLLEEVDRNPNLSALLSQRRLQEAELRSAEAQANPDWRFNAGIRRLELTDDNAFVAGVFIPLTSRNSNQGRVTEARADLDRVEADRVATRLQIETQLFAVYQALEHSLHRTMTLREEVLPRLEKAVSETQRAYKAGRYSYYELQVIQTELIATRTDLVDAAIDAHQRLIELERLTGAAMPSAVQNP
jgi:cobalt-zinc-cadmium efflux system outer membrane protein